MLTAPVIIGVIYAASGDYTAAWIVLALALLFAAISVRWAVAPPAAAAA